MRIVPLAIEHRDAVNQSVREEWGGPMIVTLGSLYDTSALPGFIALEHDALLGFVLYRIENNACEIAVLYSFAQNRGAGTALVRQVIAAAQKHDCRRVWLVTTNDNTRAIRFYQKSGFALKAVYMDSMEKSRQLKPWIPLTGEDGIPIRHEFEFELKFQST